MSGKKIIDGLTQAAAYAAGYRAGAEAMRREAADAIAADENRRLDDYYCCSAMDGPVQTCGCCAITIRDELVSAILAFPIPDEPAVDQHADDKAVDRFAAAMKEKLKKKRAEGYSGWDDPDDCSAEHLSNLLRKHVEKGDPLDVGNLAMMLHQRGERIAPKAPPAMNMAETVPRNLPDPIGRGVPLPEAPASVDVGEVLSEPAAEHKADGWTLNVDHLKFVQRLAEHSFGWRVDYLEQVEAVLLAHRQVAPAMEVGELLRVLEPVVALVEDYGIVEGDTILAGRIQARRGEEGTPPRLTYAHLLAIAAVYAKLKEPSHDR